MIKKRADIDIHPLFLIVIGLIEIEYSLVGVFS